MSNSERILIAVVMLILAIVCLIISGQNMVTRKRLDKVEIRLQSIEHLISLSFSEPRSPMFIGPTNWLPTSTDAPK